MNIVERPAAEKRKIHSKNEFELCYIRHQYFRRVKYNPTGEEMAPYRVIVKYISQRTYYTYPSLFHIIGMTFEDVQAIGSIHLVNFIGLFEIGPNKNVNKYEDFRASYLAKNGETPNDADLLDKNKALLTLFLKQRMEDLVRICRQKGRNIKGFRVDEFVPFYGPNPPPEDTSKLLEDNEALGYRRCDAVSYRAYRKKAKARHGEPFQHAGNWYVAVPLEHRNLTTLDLEGAGWNPWESEHNLGPQEILIRREEEIRFDKKRKMFKNYSKEDKVKVVLEFVEKNTNNPIFREEIGIAKKYLKKMGFVDVT